MSARRLAPHSMKSLALAALIGFTVAIGVRPTVAIEPNQVPWVKDIPTALEIAKQRNQLVMVHFTSESCPPCRRLEQHVFNQPYFGHAVSQIYVPVCVNVTLQPKIASEYQVQSWPTDIVLSAAGQEVHRMVSPQDGAQYLRVLQQVAWNHQQHQSSSAAMLAAYRSGQSSVPPNSASSPIQQVIAGMTPAQATSSDSSSIYATQGATTAPASPPAHHHAVPSMPQVAMVTANNGPAESIYGTSADATPQYVNNPYLAPSVSTPIAEHSSAPSVAAAIPSAPPMVPNSDLAGAIQGTAFVSSASTPPNPPSAASSAPLNAFGLDGYCPVTVMDENQWVAGERQWGAQHRGRVYLFRDAASQQRFLANPERYAPALAGFDPVLVTESGQYTPGLREHGVRYNDRMYLFGSEESLQKFSQSPDEYVARVEQALKEVVAR